MVHLCADSRSLSGVIALLVLAAMLQRVDSNFTIVVIVLVRSTTYADQRIVGPGIDIAVSQIRQKYPALGDFKVIILKDELINTCDKLEDVVVSQAAKLYYQKLNSSHPISTFIGTTCTFGNQQLLDPLFRKELKNLFSQIFSKFFSKFFSIFFQFFSIFFSKFVQFLG
jgi:hypothetical protein